MIVSILLCFLKLGNKYSYVSIKAIIFLRLLIRRLDNNILVLSKLSSA
jgi:hypothetical protein